MSIEDWAEENVPVVRPTTNVVIRPAHLNDSRFIFNLSQDPSVREMSTRSDEFTWDQHQVWFREKLSNGLNRIWIIEAGGFPVGQVRYGKVDEGWAHWGHHWPNDWANYVAEIAISTSSNFRGKGYAKELLTTTMPWACDWLNVNRLVALVLLENKPSMTLFQHAGFTWAGREQRMDKWHARYVWEKK